MKRKPTKKLRKKRTDPKRGALKAECKIAVKQLQDALHPHKSYMTFFIELFPKTGKDILVQYHIRQFMRGTYANEEVLKMVRAVTAKRLGK
jgi:hypothetical protein